MPFTFKCKIDGASADVVADALTHVHDEHAGSRFVDVIESTFVSMLDAQRPMCSNCADRRVAPMLDGDGKPVDREPAGEPMCLRCIVAGHREHGVHDADCDELPATCPYNWTEL